MFARVPSAYTRSGLNAVMKQSLHGRLTASCSLLWIVPGLSVVPAGIVYGPQRMIVVPADATGLQARHAVITASRIRTCRFTTPPSNAHPAPLLALRCGRGRPGPGALAKPEGRLGLPPVDVALGLDALLADLLRDGLLVGLNVLLESHALLRHRALLDDRLLLVQHNLVLFVGDVRAGCCSIDVVVSDRLAFDPRLLAADRDGLLNLLGLDPLAKPRPAGLLACGADADLLLGPRHRVVSGRAPALAKAAVRAPTAIAHAVVRVQPLFLWLRELFVWVDARRVLDPSLVEGDPQLFAVRLNLRNRDEAELGAEHPRADRGPLGPCRFCVVVELLDGSDLLAIAVDDRASAPVICVCCVCGHADPSLCRLRLDLGP